MPGLIFVSSMVLGFGGLVGLVFCVVVCSKQTSGACPRACVGLGWPGLACDLHLGSFKLFLGDSGFLLLLILQMLGQVVL